MTHFPVLICYEGSLNAVEETIGEMLAPYSEELEVVPYKIYMRNDEVTHMLAKYPDAKDVRGLTKYIEGWTGHEGGIEDGKLFYYSTYNPESKWDWFSLGGRWSGMLVLKQGATGVEGISGVFDNPTGIDAAYLKDVDFEAITEKAIADAMKSWNSIQADIKKTIEEVDKETESPDELKKRQSEMKTKMYRLYNLPVRRKTYIDRVRKRSFVTTAVLDKEGWHEPAKTGWFGVSYGRKESAEVWGTKFAERFLSNPTDKTVIAIVDCHI